MKTKLYKWNIEDSLKTPEDRAAYIEAAMEANDPEFMSIALGDVAKAEGMSKVARKANVTRENLYRAFAPGGNPTITTVMRVLNALGLTIRIAPAGVYHDASRIKSVGTHPTKALKRRGQAPRNADFSGRLRFSPIASMGKVGVPASFLVIKAVLIGQYF